VQGWTQVGWLVPSTRTRTYHTYSKRERATGQTYGACGALDNHIKGQRIRNVLEETPQGPAFLGILQIRCVGSLNGAGGEPHAALNVAAAFPTFIEDRTEEDTLDISKGVVRRRRTRRIANQKKGENTKRIAGQGCKGKPRSHGLGRDRSACEAGSAGSAVVRMMDTVLQAQKQRAGARVERTGRY
jgi:hypothetical protein